MRLSPVLAALLSGLLALATNTPDSAGPDQAAQASVNDGQGTDDSPVAVHSLSVPGFSSQETETSIILVSPVLLKLECDLKNDAADLHISNVMWKHGDSEVRSNRYTYNSTDNGWRTALEVFVNSTGSYDCIFISTAEAKAKATFHIKVPDVHGGGKTLVSYNGDSIALKCDSSTYTPVEWLWYKVTGNETVQLNFSSDPSKYKYDNKTANETKLHILDLTNDDSGDYVCKAIFRTGASGGQLHITVLSLMAPLKVFLGIAAEVVILVACILGYELLSKKKENKDDVKTENEQMAHLNSEENSEASSARQRKV